MLGCLTSVLLSVGSAAGQPAPPSSGEQPPPTTAVSTPPPGSGGSGNEIVETQWGQLGPADRDFLFKVKQATLWQLPAGQKAQQKSQNPKIADVSKKLVEGHTLLGKVVDRAGLLLGVELPKDPTQEQQGFLGEIDGASGDEFEVTLVNRLRPAEGKVYALAAQMRAGSKNELIRILSNQTMATLLDQMKAVEATGRVDFNGLPSPQAPAAEPTGTNADQPPAEDGTIPSVPPDSKFTRTSGQGGAFGDNNTVFIGAVVVLIVALASMRFISRAKKTRRKSRAY
ncbi:hypothetical protein Lesp02_81820 [Lentzea sp. NBRC 105346]|uniref:DUF4142 domain-containing protein n=1 Tax=Lentzea sp. NBRC 105346 TaxID=3032205 RepID=UPI0024A03729|nr:DUF4142 domain-containing protein [Lentzea sp. NBRC 105346]GLZ35995.1 hypothetical protein Lesp02_81820 [Lentzea sp. NBRC 105346]